MRVLDPRFAAASAALGAALVLLARRRARRPRRVVITGGCGNLGSKLAAHLLRSPEDWSVVLLEHPAFHSDAKVAEGATCVLGDLADGGGAWAAALRGADAVVHFSAVNPYPNASWEESAASMLHTFNVLLLAERAGVRRVVLASSNHVMGGYKEKRSHGLVRPADPPACRSRRPPRLPACHRPTLWDSDENGAIHLLNRQANSARSSANAWTRSTANCLGGSRS